MFFKAFTATEESPLPLRLTFIVEHQTSQVLAYGELGSLRKMVDEEKLPESLFEEVRFFGSFAKEMDEQVKAYFEANKQTLYESARQRINEPDNEELREKIRQPLFSEDELRQKIGVV